MHITNLAASLLSTLAQGIEQSPILMAILALLAYPAVTSFVTKGLKALAPTVKPETLVYIASLGITGIWIMTTGDPLPGVDLGSPAETVAVWLAWAKVNSSSAQMVYDLLKASLLGGTTA